jgi:hypothetical protein
VTDLPGQAAKRVPFAELQDPVNSRIIAQERTERSFGQDGEVTFGVPGAEGPQQRGNEKNVPNGAESHDEDSEFPERGIRHGGRMYRRLRVTASSLLRGSVAG